MAKTTGRGGSARFDEAMVHSCGKELWTPASYAIHAKHCDGKPVLEGRIAARQRETALAVPVSRPQTRKQNRKSADRTPPAANGLGAIQAAATDKAIEVVIAGLMAKRQVIDNAIAALQAVSA